MMISHLSSGVSKKEMKKTLNNLVLTQKMKRQFWVKEKLNMKHRSQYSSLRMIDLGPRFQINHLILKIDQNLRC